MTHESMRNLLLALLLANALYMLWGNFARDDRKPGVAVLSERDLGPPLAVAEAVEAAGEDAAEIVVAEAGVALDSETATELSAVVGRTCVTIGPFRSQDDADSALTRYTAEGMRTAQRQESGQIFVGHWVQVRNIETREEGNATVQQLRDGGIPEAYLVTTDDEGLKISLGLFGNLEGAQRIERQAQSLGLPADISRRMSNGVFYFVDVALPQGRGAGAMIERYGEEKVLMRREATCPDS